MMLAVIALALTSCLLVGINRQINGTLVLYSSPLRASLMDHLLGFGILTLATSVLAGFTTLAALDAPW